MKWLLTGAAVLAIALPNMGFAASEAAKAEAAMKQAAVVGAELRVGFESHAARANLRTRSMTEAA